MKRKKERKNDPMKSPGKEKFCKLYAGPFWGDGKGAAEKAESFWQILPLLTGSGTTGNCGRK